MVIRPDVVLPIWVTWPGQLRERREGRHPAQRRKGESETESTEATFDPPRRCGGLLMRPINQSIPSTPPQPHRGSATGSGCEVQPSGLLAIRSHFRLDRGRQLTRWANAFTASSQSADTHARRPGIAWDRVTALTRQCAVVLQRALQ
jgi:hypothetical protein